MRNIWIIAVIAGMMIACKKNDVDSAPARVQAPAALLKDTSFTNLKYGSHEQQALDVYLPAGRSSATRLVIIIHGGGWNSGDKSDFNPYIAALQQRLPEYAFANLNYRLVSGQDNRFPAQEMDVQSAIAYLRDHADDYFISKEMIYVGISAGAHLAMLQGYKHSDAVKPKAIISFFGPVDMKDLYDGSVHTSLSAALKSVTGFTPGENAAVYEESSPINYVNAQSSPTLLLHGGKDNIVPISQANRMHATLDSLGVKNELAVYPSEGHGWSGDNLNDSFKRIEEFVKSL